MTSRSPRNRRSHVGKAKRARPETKRKKRSAGGPARIDDLLPRCDGPKMHPFKHQHAKIRYDALISDNNTAKPSQSNGGANSSSDEASTISDETIAGGEGHVFKVKINRKFYALKLFKFFDIEDGRAEWPDYEEDMEDEEIEDHIDPFHAECRAYGAIEKKIYHGNPRPDEKDWVAAPCYGYLHISAADEAVIRRKFDIKDWNRPEGKAATPIRGLVKEFIDTDPIDTKRRSARRMRKDLLMIRSAGVYVRDLFKRNYRGGLLVDFGQSFTEPHCVLRVLPEYWATPEKTQDLRLFYQMLEENRIKYRAGCMPERIIPTRQWTSRQKKKDP